MYVFKFWYSIRICDVATFNHLRLFNYFHDRTTTNASKSRLHVTSQSTDCSRLADFSYATCGIQIRLYVFFLRVFFFLI